MLSENEKEVMAHNNVKSSCRIQRWGEEVPPRELGGNWRRHLTHLHSMLRLREGKRNNNRQVSFKVVFLYAIALPASYKVHDNKIAQKTVKYGNTVIV